MRVDEGLAPRHPRDRRACVTVGVLDGVHRGHRALVEETVRVARAADADAVVVTFEPHPRCVLDPDSCPPTLSLRDEKAALLADLGVDRMVVLPFTRELSELSAEAFCDALRESFDLVALVAGYDVALGHRRQGDIEFLRAWGGRHGIAVSQVAALELLPGTPASSSGIRAMLAEGDVRAAGDALGHAYSVAGPVVPGEKMGRQLGFPTANIDVDADKCFPANGVYACWVQLRGEWHMAATSVGVRPTFNGTRLTVEAFVLDFDEDIYDERVTCVFVERLREERRYEVIADLVAQMVVDVEEARALLATSPPLG